jgi:NADH:ubiquinone reductase (H+-translocating)
MDRIVIVGGGAGGMGIATRLGRRLGRRKKAHVTLIDCAESHVWKPLLHEVATGALDVGIDAISYRGHASVNGYHFQQAGWPTSIASGARSCSRPSWTAR